MRKIGLIFVMLLIAVFAISAYEMEPPGIIEIEGITLLSGTMVAEVAVSPVFQTRVSVATMNLNEATKGLGLILPTLARDQASPARHGGLVVRLKYPLSPV